MIMNIGIAKEIKPFEGRIALTPNACNALISLGHHVFVEKDAGILSGYDNEEYERVGVRLCASAKDLYQQCYFIVKVKEPIAVDLQYLTAEHTLFCFLHLAANPTLTTKLLDIGLTAVGFESIRDNDVLSILKPMSEIAGKLSVQIGSNLMHLQQGGIGVLLGGIAGFSQEGIDKGQVLILGAGSAGTQAALLASNMGANVYVYDKYPPALDKLTQLNASIHSLSDEKACIERLPSTQLLIGALLVPGKKTPRLIKRSHLKLMQQGSVIVDISVDQGGCIESTHPTTYGNPTFIEEGITHFCVTNMPGAVPRTATQALSAILPSYIHRLTLNNWFENDKIMRNAVNTKNKKLLINI
ncbi:MAG: alanine dehydrogenase [Cycloclasticus sp.]|nr:MAG: alanine dehydrogenase [Cycloclasticus sp.]